MANAQSLLLIIFLTKSLCINCLSIKYYLFHVLYTLFQASYKYFPALTNLQGNNNKSQFYNITNLFFIYINYLKIQQSNDW